MISEDIAQFLTFVFYIAQATIFHISSYFVLEPRYSFRKSLELSFLLALFSNLLVSFLGINSPYKFIISFSTLLLAVRILGLGSVKACLFATSIFYLLAMFLEVAMIWILYAAGISEQIRPDNPYFVAAYNFAFTFLYLFLSCLAILIWKQQKQQILPVSMRLVFLLPASQFVLLLACYSLMLNWQSAIPSAFGGWLLTFLGTLLIVPADVQLWRIVRANSEKVRIEAQMKILKQQAQRELEYYNSVNDKVLETRKIRHDFQNQLQTAYRIFLSDAETGKAQAAAQLRQLEERIEESAPAYFCPNILINAILTEKSRKCREAYIDFSADIALPASLSIEAVDLCSVFSNLLDNALTAACAAQRPAVKISAYLKSGYCVIKTANSMAQHASLPPLPKAPAAPSLHGYGLLILNSIAEQYHGQFTLREEEGMCMAAIKLQIS